MIDYAVLLKFILTIAAVSVLICRIAKMTYKTRRAVRYQHIILCSALLFSLALAKDWGNIVLCLGVLVYFCYSKKRWSETAPLGTTRRMYMNPQNYHEVAGRLDG